MYDEDLSSSDKTRHNFGPDNERVQGLYVYLPSDYDSRGWLKLPLLFWAVLLLQARTWALFVLAGASRGQGEALLGLFYPDRQSFWLGLAAGLPALLTFLFKRAAARFPPPVARRALSVNADAGRDAAIAGAAALARYVGRHRAGPARAGRLGALAAGLASPTACLF